MGAAEVRKKIRITIDGKEYVTRDDDQEAASLLRLAGRDPEKFDLARLDHEHEPKRFKDGKVIDLADGDAFMSVKHRLKITITIDGEPFTTEDDDQEAAALLRLAGLNPDEYDLARVKTGRDPKVFKDEKVIDLEDGDAFISIKQSSPVA